MAVGSTEMTRRPDPCALFIFAGLVVLAATCAATCAAPCAASETYAPSQAAAAALADMDFARLKEIFQEEEKPAGWLQACDAMEKAFAAALKVTGDGSWRAPGHHVVGIRGRVLAATRKVVEVEAGGSTATFEWTKLKPEGRQYFLRGPAERPGADLWLARVSYAVFSGKARLAFAESGAARDEGVELPAWLAELVKEEERERPSKEKRRSAGPSSKLEAVVDPDWRVLNYDIQDPMDPLTIRAVMGCRAVYAGGANVIKMIFGCSFNKQGGASNTYGYEIYSPDDPDFMYERFVQPTSVSYRSTPDVVQFSGPMGQYIIINEISLSLPRPMKPGRTYYVRARGGGPVKVDEPEFYKERYFRGYALTHCRNAGKVIFGKGISMKVPSNEVVRAVYGIRGVFLASPRHLQLVFGTATNPSQRPEDYAISSDDDPTYEGGRNPLKVWRRTFMQHYVNAGGQGNNFRAHDIYLQLPARLEPGRTYTVAVPASVTPARNRVTFEYSDPDVRNLHLKVNQLGYLPDSPVKWGFLGAWMGDGGHIDYSDVKAFHVVDLQSGRTVFSGAPKSRHKANQPEDRYGEPLCKEDVYVLDFSSFSRPGEYKLVVPGAGSSFPFRIARDVFREAFQVSIRGVFYQRCGQAMGPPFTEFRRIACHTEQPVEFLTIKEFNEFPKVSLVDKSIKPKVIVGGHHDAGDYHPRGHWEVAEHLMRVYELFPEKYWDGQLKIPEAGNGIPDILDEAYWSLQLFEQLQFDHGGVPINIESPGDPNVTETPERDALRMFSNAPSAKGSLVFAALSAQASRLWRRHGKTEEAKGFLANALKAYGWAMGQDLGKEKEFWGWAAAELAHTTGSQKYVGDYEKADPRWTDNNYHAAAAWAVNETDTGSRYRSRARSQLISVADPWIRNADTMAYPYVKHEYTPIDWGSGAFPTSPVPMLIAYRYSRDPKYYKWMVHTYDYVLGCNPLNLIHITGLGQNAITSPGHCWGFHTYHGVCLPGQQSEGPYDPSHWGRRSRSESILHPALDTWPFLYVYFEDRSNWGMSEGVVRNQVTTAAFLAALIPSTPKRERTVRETRDEEPAPASASPREPPVEKPSSPEEPERPQERPSRRAPPPPPKPEKLEPPEMSAATRELRERFKEAETAFIEGDLERAKKLLHAIIKESPDSEEAEKAKAYLDILD